MDANNLMLPTVSEAHPETLDFLSRSWCDFAIQALQPKLHDQSPLSVPDTTMKMFESDTLKMGNSIKIEDADYMKSRRSRKSNELKFQWKKPFGNVSTKKWVKEMKEKRKEQKRLQKAEVHAAVSIAGLAAALAAIAEENSKGKLELEHEESPSRKAALAAAAAIVASQCALVAHSLGATRGQLSNVISSALSGTSTSDILTLTAAGSTSLRGVATLKGRAGFNRALNGAPVLPIKMDNSKLDYDLDFESCASVLARGAPLTIRTADGKSMVRLVSLHLNNEAKVILRIMKLNLLNVMASKKECLVLDLQAELIKTQPGMNMIRVTKLC